VAQFADGVIVGSAFVQCLLDAQDTAAGVAAVADLAADLARGVRAVPAGSADPAGSTVPAGSTDPAGPAAAVPAAHNSAARSDDAPSAGDSG
jgi:hypothetical protein